MVILQSLCFQWDGSHHRNNNHMVPKKVLSIFHMWSVYFSSNFNDLFFYMFLVYSHYVVFQQNLNGSFQNIRETY